VASPSHTSTPISNATRRGIPLAIFGSIFALCGFAFLIPFFGLPMLHILEARGWREVPCTILNSQVLSHPSDESGSTYSIKMSFEYDFGDVRYVGTHYNFSSGSSSGHDYRQAIVQRLHHGTHTVCYVNPNRPAEAVIDRGVGREMWFALLPLVFVIIGVSIVVHAVRKIHPKPLPGTSSTGQAGTTLRGNPAQLKEAQSPPGKLLAIGLFAIFWNGIVSVFVHDAYFSSRTHVDWFERVFLIPFILIGLGTIAAWFYQLLALYNPRPQIVLINQAISLGQSSEVRWSFTGNFSRISRLTIFVEGRERAICQQASSSSKRANDTTIENNTFARIRIADITRQRDIGSGRGIFTIPSNTMHSFASQHNKIIWTIALHGTISGWPDVKSDFSISVGALAIQKVRA
jgi:hypothetical protein